MTGLGVAARPRSPTFGLDVRPSSGRVAARRSKFELGWALLLACLLAACAGDAGDSGDDPVADRAAAEPDAAPIPDSIRAELLVMGREDQALRQDLTPERMRDTVFARELLRGDSLRSARLRAIVDRYGWPDSARVGARAANAAFLVLQHSPDSSFQAALAPRLDSLARRGELPPSDVALLVDRVRMRAGRPQLYGTQFTLDGDRWVLHPVEDEEGLEARRREMGLPPMEDYMRMMEQFYGAPVVRTR